MLYFVCNSTLIRKHFVLRSFDAASHLLCRLDSFYFSTNDDSVLYVTGFIYGSFAVEEIRHRFVNNLDM